MTETQQYLVSLGACQEARDWVGDRTLQAAWEACYRLDWMRWLLEAPIQAEYEAKHAPIRAEAIRAEYLAKHAPIRAEYRAKLDPIWAEYEAKRAQIWAEYLAKLDPIWACRSCDEIRARFKCPRVS